MFRRREVIVSPVKSSSHTDIAMTRFSLQTNMQTFDTLQCEKSGFALPYYLELCLAQGEGGGGGATQQMFIRVQPLTLLYTIFTKKVPLSYTFC